MYYSKEDSLRDYIDVAPLGNYKSIITGSHVILIDERGFDNKRL